MSFDLPLVSSLSSTPTHLYLRRTFTKKDIFSLRVSPQLFYAPHLVTVVDAKPITENDNEYTSPHDRHMISRGPPQSLRALLSIQCPSESLGILHCDAHSPKTKKTSQNNQVRYTRKEVNVKDCSYGNKGTDIRIDIRTTSPRLRS